MTTGEGLVAGGRGWANCGCTPCRGEQGPQRDGHANRQPFLDGPAPPAPRNKAHQRGDGRRLRTQPRPRQVVARLGGNTVDDADPIIQSQRPNRGRTSASSELRCAVSPQIHLNPRRCFESESGPQAGRGLSPRFSREGSSAKLCAEQEFRELRDGVEFGPC